MELVGSVLFIFFILWAEVESRESITQVMKKQQHDEADDLYSLNNSMPVYVTDRFIYSLIDRQMDEWLDKQTDR